VDDGVCQAYLEEVGELGGGHGLAEEVVSAIINMGKVFGIVGHLGDEGLVDFDDIDGELAKKADAGIAGAEVIDGNTYTHLF
jgi:hypothetical protein